MARYSNESDKPELVEIDGLRYITYSSENQLKFLTKLMENDLSEPYSIYTYRYFLNNWPDLCWLAMHGEECVGAIVSKQDIHKGTSMRGYIAMLAVRNEFRGRGIGSQLVILTMEVMKRYDCEEVVLETEITNEGALKLYKNLGFIKVKYLKKYYMNGVDAWRVKIKLD